jgi:hypothetical protein
MLKLIFAAALVAGPLACFPLIIPAAAGEGERLSSVKDPVVVKECGVCHMVYHPIFLPARSWQKIVGGLKDHFGENAELDEATTKRIAEYLTANAGDRGYFQGWAAQGLSASETPLRITDAPWWLRIHEKHSRNPALQRAHAKARGDCAACHSGKKRGYEDDR